MSVYEDRQRAQRAIDGFRDEARRIATLIVGLPPGVELSVPDHAHVQPSPDGGAFVEIVMFVREDPNAAGTVRS